MLLTFRLLVLVLTLAWASTSAAQEETGFADQQVLDRWLARYYVQPQPDRVGLAVHAASVYGLLDDIRAPGFFGFLAGVVQQDPGMARSLAEELSFLPARDQPVAILGFWYSGYPDMAQLLSTLAESMPSRKAIIDVLTPRTPPRLLELPLEEGPWVLDAYWGYFLATGAEAPILKIIAALPWSTSAADTPEILVGSAARWSLISNAVQHDRIMAICREQLALQPQAVADVLKEVIQAAEGYRAIP